jgi:hypothetical protein
MVFGFEKFFSSFSSISSILNSAADDLKKITIEAESGAGLVKVKVNCLREVISISIDERVIEEADKEILQELLKVALNKALKSAEEKAISEITQKISSNPEILNALKKILEKDKL